MATTTKKKAPKSGGPVESFVTEKWHRSKFHGAPYNPRTIDDKAKRKLKAALEKRGLVAPITVNRRTGNIVGGHQRISALDALHGPDYELTVAVIDVDENEEKALNLLLNNQEAGGQTDMEKLDELIRGTPGLDLTLAGYDHADMIGMLGVEAFVEGSDNDAIEEMTNKLREARDAYTSIENASAKRDDTHFYFVVVCKGPDECEALLGDLGFDAETRFVSEESLREAVGLAGDDADADEGEEGDEEGEG